MSFYVTLPSNGADLKSEYGKKTNTMSDFNIYLKEKLEFNENNYEVGLVECSYRKNWNIKLCNIKLFRYIGILRNEKPQIDINIFVPDGISIEKMIKIFNDQIPNKYVKFSIVDNQLGIFVKYNYEVEINGYFVTLLNFDKYRSICKPEFIIFNFPDTFILTGNPTNNFKIEILSNQIKFVEEMFIHTNIIKPVHVGEDMIKLLRIITDDSDYDSIVCKSFTDPHYTQLDSRSIERIRMTISDSEGEKIKFNNIHSRIVYKLHFRPINHL